MKCTSKTIVWLLVTVMLASLALTACSTGDKILGKWKEITTDMTFEFLKDNVLSVTAVGIPTSGTYKIVDDTHMQITMTGLLGFAGAQVTTYTLDGDTLILNWAGTSITFRRVK